MKKILLAAMVCLPITSFAASENTIQFQGEVTDQTCSVAVNGMEANPTVQLPTVPASTLVNAGDVAGLTMFTVSLTGCTASNSTDQTVNTVFAANNLTADGRIGNTGDAKNVTLQLVDPKASGTILDVTGTTVAPGLVIKQDDTSASYDFGVQYYAEAQAEAGSVLGSVQYAVSYK